MKSLGPTSAGSSDKTPFVPAWATLPGSAWPAEKTVGDRSKGEPGRDCSYRTESDKPGVGRGLPQSELGGAACVAAQSPAPAA